MALERSFAELEAAFRRLAEKAADLRVSVVEDRPSAGESLLAERWADTVVQIETQVEEGVHAARDARRAAHPIDLEELRGRLLLAQTAFNSTLRTYLSDLMESDVRNELERLGRRRGGEWKLWPPAVELAVDECRQPLTETLECLAGCWNELAERIGTTLVSVRAEAIGRVVSMPPAAQVQEVLGRES